MDLKESQTDLKGTTDTDLKKLKVHTLKGTQTMD